MNFVESNECDFLQLYEQVENELKQTVFFNCPTQTQTCCKNLVKSYLNNEMDFYFYRFCFSYSMYAIKSYGQERR